MGPLQSNLDVGRGGPYLRRNFLQHVAWEVCLQKPSYRAIPSHVSYSGSGMLLLLMAGSSAALLPPPFAAVDVLEFLFLHVLQVEAPHERADEASAGGNPEFTQSCLFL